MNSPTSSSNLHNYFPQSLFSTPKSSRSVHEQPLRVPIPSKLPQHIFPNAESRGKKMCKCNSFPRGTVINNFIHHLHDNGTEFTDPDKVWEPPRFSVWRKMFTQVHQPWHSTHTYRELLLRYSELSECWAERKSPTMTMMASFLSNINIPAGSLLFPPGRSHCSILKKLSVKAWYFPPLCRVYLLVSRWCANLSHQAQTALFPQSKGQSHSVRRETGVCVLVCYFVMFCTDYLRRQTLLTTCSIKHECNRCFWHLGRHFWTDA